MQDTQKFQDELLRDIFPLGNSEIIVQRFGDPDQAIFHGIGSEESNDSFNGKLTGDMDFVVHKSHRFDGQLADKIKNLSFNGIPLETELTEEILVTRSQAHSSGENFEHCVIIFNDDTLDGVIQSFGDIVFEQFNEGYRKSNKFIVKALGAVGNEIDPNLEQLKIGHYWIEYDKSKAKNKFKENSLIEAVRYCRQSSSPDWSDSYKLLLNSVLKLLRLAGKNNENDHRYTGTSLQNFLKANNNWKLFRKILYCLLNDEQSLDQECWENICNNLTSFFDLQDSPEAARQYLAYTEEILDIESQDEEIGEEDNRAVVSLPENMIKHHGGFSIHLSTIHGVKGETHDATLVMETKYRKYDIGELLNHVAGIDVNRVTQKTKIKFSRQLYVAASRPRHLLCFSIHEKRISQPQRDALENLGWCLCDLADG